MCFFLTTILASNSLLASQSHWKINQITDELTNKKNVLVSSNFTTQRGEKLNLSYKCEVLNTKLIGSFELTTENGFLAIVLAKNGTVYSPVRIRYGKDEVVSANFIGSKYLVNQFNQSFDFEINELNVTVINKELSSTLRKRFIENFGLEFVMDSGEKVVFKNNGELATYFDNHCVGQISKNLIKAKSDRELTERHQKIEHQNLLEMQNEKKHYFQSDEYSQLISMNQESSKYILKDFEQLIKNNALRAKEIDQNIQNDILSAYNKLTLAIQYECITTREIRYPKIAQDRGIEGTTDIKINFDENGNFINSVLISSSGNHALDEATINAFSKCMSAEKLSLITTSLIKDQISSVITGLNFKSPKKE